MDRILQTRLSTMMFLEFFVWGAWYVTVGNYMTTLGMEDHIFWAYMVNPFAAIISPFFLGMIADRFFDTEKIMGVLHIVGGVFMFLAPIVAETTGSVTLFILFLLLHNLCFAPTLSLVNSLSFHHLTNQEKQFPVIRVLGTIGWIVAGVFVSAVLHADLTPIPLYISGVAGLLMGLYSFSLPHTPPPSKGEKATFREISGIDALSKLNSRSFVVFIVASFLICIPLQAYYTYAPVFLNAADIADPAFKMSFGQMSEVLFMLLMPVFFARLGVKWMLMTGMLAWVLRYGLFAAAAPSGILWMILLGILLHGICYDFFFVTGQIYVDKKSTKAIRGQAQGFLTLATLGAGMFVGALVSGALFNNVVTANIERALGQWQVFWIIPAAFAGLIAIIFFILFKEDVSDEPSAEEVPSPA